MHTKQRAIHRLTGILIGLSAGCSSQAGSSGNGAASSTQTGAGGAAGAADSGAAGAAGGSSAGTGCSGLSLPPTSDYGGMGPYTTTMVTGTGPDGQYTMFRPDPSGDGSVKYAPATWGNGIGTAPKNYIPLLSTIASHGFVVIASNSSNVTAPLMTAGLDWLLGQNDAAGELQGKLATSCAVSIGYSLGGGAAVNTGKHPNVITTVSFHGLTGDSASLHGPLLLYTGVADTFVSAAQFVDPTYRASTVQTFYGTLTGTDSNHLRPLNDAGDERAPTVAWLRLWVYGDQAARPYFYGNDCTLCADPWTNPQRKNWQ
jgi:hypothetical protein